jgi:hypothetical protein
MTKKPTNIAASVKARLITAAKERGEEYNLLFMRYGIERLLYRLSVSAYADKFLLKGAMLYTLWDAIPHRPTRDLDLLGFVPAERNALVKIFREVIAVPVPDDGIVFDTDSVIAEDIREEDAYGGIRVKLVGRVGNSKMPVKIDIGSGDAVTPEAENANFPTILDFPAPHIRAYPIYTVVAEKLEAAVKLGVRNTRMKDFYDLLYLSKRFEFDGPTLKRAIEATFQRRGTPLPNPDEFFPASFAEDPMKQKQWEGFLWRNQLTVEPASLPEVMEEIRQFYVSILSVA